MCVSVLYESVQKSLFHPLVRGDTELHFTFKLPHSRSCVRELCVSAEVSPHALGSMIEKMHTKPAPSCTGKPMSPAHDVATFLLLLPVLAVLRRQ